MYVCAATTRVPRPFQSTMLVASARGATATAVARTALLGVASAAIFLAATSAIAVPNAMHYEKPEAGFFEDITARLNGNAARLRYGVSIVDVDNDGLFEAFVCGYGGANSLYRWNGARLEDIAPRLGVDAVGRQAIGVASCDIDGDGKEEIYVLNTDSYSGDKAFSDHLFALRGGNKYEDIMTLAVNGRSRSSFAGRSVACVDRTGEGKYGVAAASYGRPLLLYEMADAKTSAVRDVADSAGFAGITGGRGITGGPLYPGKDYTTSPGMDVYMDNENGASFFFRNDGHGHFTEVAGRLGLADAYENGRGVALLDANADGRVDLVVRSRATLTLSSDTRVPRTVPLPVPVHGLVSSAPFHCAAASCMAQVGNWMGRHRLWLSPPAGSRSERFDDAAPREMAEPSAIRTVVVADFDNDGYEEIFFNNICSCRHDMPSMCTESNRLFRTTDGRHWQMVPIGSAAERYGRGTGAAAYDADGDGILELLISHGESPECRCTQRPSISALIAPRSSAAHGACRRREPRRTALAPPRGGRRVDPAQPLPSHPAKDEGGCAGARRARHAPREGRPHAGARDRSRLRLSVPGRTRGALWPRRRQRRGGGGGHRHRDVAGGRAARPQRLAARPDARGAALMSELMRCTAEPPHTRPR